MRHYFSVHVSPYHCFFVKLHNLDHWSSSIFLETFSGLFCGSVTIAACTPKSKSPTNMIILAVLIFLRLLIRPNVPIWIHQMLKGYLTDTFVLIIQRKHRFPELFVFPQIYDDRVYLVESGNTLAVIVQVNRTKIGYIIERTEECASYVITSDLVVVWTSVNRSIKVCNW